MSSVGPICSAPAIGNGSGPVNRHRLTDKPPPVPPFRSPRGSWAPGESRTASPRTHEDGDWTHRVRSKPSDSAVVDALDAPEGETGQERPYSNARVGPVRRRIRRIRRSLVDASAVGRAWGARRGERLRLPTGPRDANGDRRREDAAPVSPPASPKTQPCIVLRSTSPTAVAEGILRRRAHMGASAWRRLRKGLGSGGRPHAVGGAHFPRVATVYGFEPGTPESVRTPSGVRWYCSLSMSKRFPEFSRLYWQTIRPKPRPRLHPAMVERMWKPGQSGNPAGVSKAYLEAMQEMAIGPLEVSAGAERTRRWRQRRRQGVIVVRFDAAPDITAKLIRLGWLDAAERGDKEVIAAVFIELAEKAIELEITPASCSA
jgi:hypothetical protein